VLVFVLSLHLEIFTPYEKNISAIGKETQKQTRIPRENVNQEWAQSPCQQKGQRKKKANRF